MVDTSLRMLIVFIHGFRGSDTTFKEFPEQVRTSLLNLLPQAHVNIAVYPQFETRGSLSKAVDNFCTWLKGIEAHRRSQPGGSTPLLTILIGHSMGGLLAGDAYLRFLQGQKLKTSEPNSASKEIFPHILGVLAFDSPFYGISQSSLSQTAYSRVSSLGDQFNSALGLGSVAASNVRSLPLKKPAFRTLALGGLAVATFAAAGAYLYKDKIPTLYSYAMEHLEFINALGNKEELAQRVRDLIEAPDGMFWCLYIETVKKDGTSYFINLPGEKGAPSVGSEYFLPIKCHCQDEVQAHMNMFDPSLNSNYFIMAQKAVSSMHHAIRQFQAQSS